MASLGFTSSLLNSVHEQNGFWCSVFEADVHGIQQWYMVGWVCGEPGYALSSCFLESFI